MDAITDQVWPASDEAFAIYRAKMLAWIRELVRTGRLTEVGQAMAELERETARHDAQHHPSGEDGARPMASGGT